MAGKIDPPCENITVNVCYKLRSLYSLVETAKANDLQPIDYLMSLFEQWPLIKGDDDIDHLLPWNIELTH